ncbi:hypothetical protein NHH03_06075 [Stieleria sp. TO1_6]|uniref:hypothetical protein n=1 Tax=Stieleria tagensis TaxID=2956795 RepID=UPI00209BB6BA|nr:hypothetical protein [Stieleria tagensis]MCO8121298.1 hypothetical protein [Stieleria tagensis]
MATTIDPPADTDQTISSTTVPPATKPKRKPKKKTLAGKMGRSTLMMIRRVHLYSGIFMFPWVLLYGFTGWFFNHPRMFTGDQVTAFVAADVDSDLLGNLPTAAETAQSVVDEMNLESFMIGGPEISLTQSRQPRFTGFLSYTVNADKSTHQVSINPVTGNGEIRTSFVTVDSDAEQQELKPNPIAAIRSVNLPTNALSDAQDQVPVLLEKLGLESGEAFSGRRSASVVFSAEADGVPCIVTYSLAGGGISSLREDERPTIETKSFLQRLHLARMYSPDYDIRWVWALLVDAMFVSMVFWGISGLFMWWQVKRTRILGGGVLVASVVFAAIMAIGMHDQLTLGSGRGGGGGGRGGRGSAAAEPAAESSLNVAPKTTLSAPVKSSVAILARP